MNFTIQYDNPKEDLLTRLFKVRGIDDNIDSFLNPKFNDYRTDPFLLNDMEKWVERIIKALKNNEKIMIFGDYDVDGVTASYLIYKFLTKFLNYKNVSIQYPDRVTEWYGIKCNHIDEIKEKWVSLIITVDNGITCVQEALHAKEIWVDLIITDHHKDLSTIPEAFAVINPQVSPNYPFKWLAGVWVAFKVVAAIMEKSKFTKEKKTEIFNYFLPIVAIWTVADVVPLINENRVIVKKGLELINKYNDKIPSSLRWFLNFLNLKDNVDTFHIWFIIWPRINAGWRIESPYQSLNALLYSWDKQLCHLQRIEEINTERRKMQEESFKLAEKQLDHEQKIMIVSSEDLHEWIVWIVAWRICEKYNKPSIVAKIDPEKWVIVASLRWPAYFNVIEMIWQAAPVLLRFGGHRWAGGLSTTIDHFDEVLQIFKDYCNEKINESDLEKTIKIDTRIYHEERWTDAIESIEKLAPFWEWNQEPVFLIENVIIDKIEKVWKKWAGHLKLHGKLWGQKFVSMFRWKWEMENEVAELLAANETLNIIWKVKKDTFNGWFFIDWVDFR